MPRADFASAITWDILFQQLANEAQILEEQSSFNSNAAEAIRASLHKQQGALVEDPARYKAALCPRRVGKSWAAMSYAHTTCLDIPNARVVICTLTLKSAKNIYWWEMQQFAQYYGLTLDYNVNELRVDFPNGSQIMLIGMESRQQIDKLRGGKYHLVIIDECKSFPKSVFDELLVDVIEPALGDYQGTLLLIGTPGSILEGPFYEATMPGLLDDRDGPLKGLPFSRTFLNPEAYWEQHRKAKPRWSRHTWTQKDNKALPHLWQEALDKKERNGWDDNDPTWLREYLAHWVAMESAHVYVFPQLLRTCPERVTWRPDPKSKVPFGLDPTKTWHYLLGIDYGFEDDTALVIGAYSDEEQVLYHCWDFKDIHLDVDQVGKQIEECIAMVPKGFDAIVADFGGGGKQITATFNRRYGINIIPAEKRDKFDYIELLNADYRSGRIRLNKAFDLCLEKQMLTWDLGDKGKQFLAHAGKLREHPALPNHLCDAWLYLWRYSYHFFAQRAEPGPDKGSREWLQAETLRAMETAVKRRAEQASGDWMDREFGSEGEDVAQEYMDQWQKWN